MSVFETPSPRSDERGWAWMGGTGPSIISAPNGQGKSALLGALSLVLGDHGWLRDGSDVTFHVQGSGKAHAALAYQLSYLRRIDAAHLAADIVVRDEVHVLRHDAYYDGFTEHVRQLKTRVVDTACRAASPPIGPSPLRREILQAATVSAASMADCAVDANVLARCDDWTTEARDIAARPAPAAFFRKRTRQVERFLERVIAEVDSLGRRAGRDIARYVLGEPSSPGELADRPPLSRIITLFQTSMVGTLTRNAPPASA